MGTGIPSIESSFFFTCVTTDQLAIVFSQGKYSGHAVAVDQNEEELFCITMDFDLK